MSAPDLTPDQKPAGTDPDCLFCRIVAGDLPARLVHTDEHAVAFLDLNGWHRGHTLVVPRRHLPDLVNGDPVLGLIGPTIDAVARLLTRCLGADGVNVLSSAGAVAGQTVFHLHVHVVPRFADQPGLDRLVNPGGVPAEQLDAIHRQIQAGR